MKKKEIKVSKRSGLRIIPIWVLLYYFLWNLSFKLLKCQIKLIVVLILKDLNNNKKSKDN